MERRLASRWPLRCISLSEWLATLLATLSTLICLRRPASRSATSRWTPIAAGGEPRQHERPGLPTVDDNRLAAHALVRVERGDLSVLDDDANGVVGRALCLGVDGLEGGGRTGSETERR